MQVFTHFDFRARCSSRACKAPVVRGGLCRFHAEHAEANAAAELREYAARRERFLGVVYAVGCGDLVKIGFSRQVNRRFVNLQSISPVKLELLGHTPAMWEDEQALHRILEPAVSHHEWFHRTDPLVREAVKAIVSGDEQCLSSWIAEKTQEAAA